MKNCCSECSTIGTAFCQDCDNRRIPECKSEITFFTLEDFIQAAFEIGAAEVIS